MQARASTVPSPRKELTLPLTGLLGLGFNAAVTPSLPPSEDINQRYGNQREMTCLTDASARYFCNTCSRQIICGPKQIPIKSMANAPQFK